VVRRSVGGARGGGGRGGRSDGRAGGEPDRLVVGLHPVREVLRAGGRLHAIAVSEGRGASEVLDEILDLAEAAGVPVRTVARDDLDERAEGLVHQGVVATGPPYRYATLDEALARADAAGEPPFLVALDGVTDPHNLGSIARTADAVGAHGVIVPSRRAAGVTATAEKAAAGALAHTALVRVPNLVRALEDLRQRGVWVVGLDSDTSDGVHDAPLLSEPVVLVVGSEGRGLAHLTQVRCDQLVRLPMHGNVGSLNASVAAAVAMYEVRRRRSTS
jgi:23S rRNA (guanosine2251-2'-O)-methyltransferase